MRPARGLARRAHAGCARRILDCARRHRSWPGAAARTIGSGIRLIAGDCGTGPGAASTLTLAADGSRMFWLIKPDLPASGKRDMGETPPAFFCYRPALHLLRRQ